MNRVIIIAISLLFPFEIIAQNATLTKGETVSYLSKKIQEVVGYCRGSTKNCASTYVSASVELKNNQLEVSTKESDGYVVVYIFNPKNIISLSQGDHYSNDEYLKDYIFIKFSSKIAIKKITYADRTSKTEYVQEVDFTYLDSDNSNGDKVRKALLHLQALLKAEDDPFEN